ncbi:response regulator [Roseospira marina]|uniref:Regulatory protein VirG n=1 Tax=Roseospira marina TaxID=140057 RepID=A0A5M6I817_9PROT|nr:response regulator [Roseospira marina]KAA5604331.1 response regulator [Roseospira marina]MBB4315644.1 two-component system OmpR family response regulator [Roseospira marina]MBB5088702.1 two-component system OmpR family response regulator [Roseospira marina]
MGLDPAGSPDARPRVLVVDDTPDIRELLARYLGQHGLTVDAAADAAAARAILTGPAEQRPDLLILDLMMPGEDGLSLCRALRADPGTAALPIVMLTAMGEETDRVVGLELGADDYISKPFNPRELLARVRAVLRRAAPAQGLANGSGAEDGTPPIAPRLGEAGRVRFDRWILDLGRRELEGPDGVGVALSSGEFSMLRAFVEHPQRVLTRDQLLDLARGHNAAVTDRSMDTQVSRLRRKIEVDPKDPRLLKTVWGGGYVLAVPVERA